MYDKDQRAESFASWMIASGARFDPPDARHLDHLIALRDAQRETARSSSPFTPLAASFGRPALETSPTATTHSTTCCAPA